VTANSNVAAAASIVPDLPSTTNFDSGKVLRAEDLKALLQNIADLKNAVASLKTGGATYTPHVITFNNSGTWVVPEGVTSIIVDATGGGSGSGGVGYGPVCLIIGNTGISGHFVRNKVIPVTPGHTLAMTIGAAGSFGSPDGLNFCAAGNSGVNVGGAGGATSTVDTTTGATLLNLPGGVSLTPASAESTCDTKGCRAIYAWSGGESGFAMGAGLPTGFGIGMMPVSYFGIAPEWLRGGQDSETIAAGSGECLMAQPGYFYGQGASPSISINSPAGCQGNIGMQGVVIINY
jgi:hypothetical protein